MTAREALTFLGLVLAMRVTTTLANVFTLITMGLIRVAHDFYKLSDLCLAASASLDAQIPEAVKERLPARGAR